MSKNKHAYRHQKFNATNRGIAFLLTYAQWEEWWFQQLGSAWHSMRGSRPDEYCMARLQDTGPYQLGNIKCITNAQNRAEQAAPTPGEKNYWAKLTKRKVAYIRQSTLSSFALATKYGVHHSTINRIRAGIGWKD